MVIVLAYTDKDGKSQYHEFEPIAGVCGLHIPAEDGKPALTVYVACGKVVVEKPDSSEHVGEIVLPAS